MCLNHPSYSYPVAVFAASIIGLCPIKSPTKNNEMVCRVVSCDFAKSALLEKISFSRGTEIYKPNSQNTTIDMPGIKLFNFNFIVLVSLILPKNS
jgi:hypothetical protein